MPLQDGGALKGCVHRKLSAVGSRWVAGHCEMKLSPPVGP